MPIRLIPFDSDPESDLETQLAVMAALVTANLMSVAVLQGRQELQRQCFSGISLHLFQNLAIKVNA